MKILRVCLTQNPHHMSGMVELTAPLWDDNPGPRQKAEIASRLESHSFIGASLDEEDIPLERLKEMIR